MLVSVSQILICEMRAGASLFWKSSRRRHFIVKVLRHILGRWIDHGERLEIVDKLVVQPVDDFAHHPLQLDEIHQQADAVQLSPSTVICTR